MGKQGRPTKYKSIVIKLKNCDVYSPASIAQFALEMGALDTKTIKQSYRRIRVSLGRMTQNKRNFFPLGGDGVVYQKGQPPMPGWFGRRWKQAYSIDIEETP